MAKSGPKPRRIVTPRWTAELAYACGLVASDGCLSSDGRHINLTSNDPDQLETFKRCLEIDAKISWKSSGVTNKKYGQVQFSDTTLYRWFISIGITPRKTHTIGEVRVPDKYFFDYLRGEFDGDGSSNAYWDTRWKSSMSLYITFTSSSQKHLEWLQDSIERLAGIRGGIELRPKRPHQLRFSKKKARILFNVMYYSKTVPHLKRKKEKLDRQWEANKKAELGKQPPSFKRGGSVLRIA